MSARYNYIAMSRPDNDLIFTVYWLC